MNKKTKHIIILVVIISLMLIIGLPFVIDWFIIGSEFLSNIENSDWVGFLGGYIGSIIGAVFSLAGIIITIRYTNDQNKKDRELQVRPYCAIRYVNDDKLVGTDRIIAEIPIGCESDTNKGDRYTGIIYVKNIGLGSAIEFNINTDMDKIDDGQEQYLILMQQNVEKSNRLVNLLQPGEEAAIIIHVYFDFDRITKDDFVDFGEREISMSSLKPEVIFKYKPFDIIINMKYHDLFMNTYYQKIILSSNISICGNEKKKQVSYEGKINLKEATIPIKE